MKLENTGMNDKIRFPRKNPHALGGTIDPMVSSFYHYFVCIFTCKRVWIESTTSTSNICGSSKFMPPL